MSVVDSEMLLGKLCWE